MLAAFFSLPFGLPLLAEFASPGPILLDIGPLAIRWYGLLIAMAVLIGINLSQYLAPYRQLDPEAVGDFALWGIVGSIVGARIYYVAFEWQSYAGDWVRALQIWRGGIAIHGAILGGTIVAVIFARKLRLSVWGLLDVVAPSLILGQAIGRWGNFFNSEAFGAPTDLPWKLYIPAASRPLGYTSFEYFHPTFLYESLWNIAVFALILWLFRRGVRGAIAIAPGTIFLVYFGSYSLGRFWIEALRMDSLMLGPLRIAQVVSLIGISLAALGLFWMYALKRSLPDTANDTTASRRSRSS
ncbi:MAG: prolipoprotein diacylglyceryl transferase [Geitlerinemataceae cyanobacterium]